MPKFYIRDTFEIPTRKLFVLAGSTTEGEVKPGMLVHVPINSEMSVAARVDSIELSRREGREDVCLCLSEGPEVEALRGIDVTDELCEVTVDGGQSSNAI